MIVLGKASSNHRHVNGTRRVLSLSLFLSLSRSPSLSLSAYEHATHFSLVLVFGSLQASTQTIRYSGLQQGSDTSHVH